MKPLAVIASLYLWNISRRGCDEWICIGEIEHISRSRRLFQERCDAENVEVRMFFGRFEVLARHFDAERALRILREVSYLARGVYPYDSSVL